MKKNLQRSNFLRILLSILLVFLGCACASAQGRETKFNNSAHHAHDSCQELPVEAEPSVKERGVDDACVRASQEVEKPSHQKDEGNFHWEPALRQSFEFLGLQHGYRVLAQKHTRAQLGGPFFRDWARTVKHLRGWDDGNSFVTNYVAHPLQGGLTGRIFVTNSDRAGRQTFGKSKKYWESRLKAMAWSAVWSTQFELGPLSEADIGNVGLLPKPRHSPMAYVDLVVTPVLGTAVLVGEDAVDKYVLKNRIERKGSSKLKIKLLRSFLTPTMSILNLSRGRAPWRRDDR
ncbi:MAG: hypothetical protein ACJ741_07095 [Pyrinomonadaceae bacterium]